MSLDEQARAERRIAQSRRMRRRRVVALGVLLAAAAAVVLVVVVLSSGDDGGGSGGDESVASTESTSRTKDDTAPAKQAPAARQAKFAGPLPSKALVSREPVPILMYHVIDAAPPGAPLPELYVSKDEFEAHMRALKQAGYHGVTLDQVYNRWHGGPALPKRPVVVSMDDGYKSWSDNALPALERLGWPAVINVQVDLLGSKELTKRDVRRMIAAGWEVDSHTFSHPNLPGLGAEQLEREVAGSRKDLQKRLGVPVNFLCYPAGQFDDAVVAAAEKAGYRGATTVEPGAAEPGQPYAMKRVRVNPGTSPEKLVSELEQL